ncbi:ribonuclease, Rne/Rng family [Thalassoporum mexicanum PCC 7367]|uniref:Rne/Rng family ribonuclease n=1 Tax=Thalassoporum mexicanum TaxID=3457544 RepID=UPI00029F85D5|nr:Rne/Rng family ribonuclease [Pseudanabaena sp. PCC 7367]AFY70110.1 ribonuclease, Rne/Rng family [Pseudanabaena sp. PCC 7367]
MPKQIIIAEQHRIAAVFSEDRIEEIVVATGTHQVGDIYMGAVENILTSIDAAFVNIGESDRNGFIHITDLGPLRVRRSSGSISDLLSPQQRVLVQIMKEPTGNKGPRLTGNISMPGRYVVLMPYGRGVNLSRRIRNEGERSRLRALAILIKPAGMGLLVRTEAEGVSEDAIIEDLENLQRQWQTIQQEAPSGRTPRLLNRDSDFIQKVLRDLYTNDVNRIVADTNDGLKRVKQHLLNWSEGKIPNQISLDHHRESTPILEFFRVNAAIREALRPRVDLPSGGYIIIEPTEALTVIDVNSGSFTRSQTSRETVLWTNCEAAEEIARQMRLRNIAGVIIVDFIDMDSRKDQIQLLEAFNKAIHADKSRPQIAQLTELGLVELTRKRQGQSIYELFGHSCPTCSGLGLLAHLPGEKTLQPAETIPRLDKTIQLDLGDRDRGLGGGTEANLVSHPSYQEARGNGGSRRRRRSSKDSDKSSSSSSNRDRDREQSNKVIPAPSKNNDKPVVVSSNPNNDSPEPQTTRLSNVSKSESSASKSKQEQKKTEPIVVEMTVEEQEIYAHMGISPVVLLDDSAKDVRNAMVMVALPGMAQQVKETQDQQKAASNGNGNSGSNSGGKRRRSSASNSKRNTPETVNSAPIKDVKDSDRSNAAESAPVEAAVVSKAKPQLENQTEMQTGESTDEASNSDAQPIQSPAASRRRRRTSTSK